MNRRQVISVFVVAFGLCCSALSYADEARTPDEPLPFRSIGDSDSESDSQTQSKTGSVSEADAASFETWMAGYESGCSCETECTETCCDCAPRWWVHGDYLLWWTKGQNLPPLVTTSPAGTPRPQAGVLGFNTTTLFGAERAGDGERHGTRWSVGRWLDDDHCRALEAQWFSVGDDNSTGNFFASSTGNPILARPFFNVTLGREDSQLVAFPNLVAGQIAVSSSSEFHSGSLLLRSNLRQGWRGRLDLLTGYRYFGFREDLLITENLVSTDPAGIVQQGTTIDLFDRFETENDFHGGDVGLAMQLDHDCWTFGALGKVALGNLHQRLLIDGGTVVSVPGGSTTSRDGGLLALPTNIGSLSRDQLAFLPEFNANVDYHFNACWSLSVGYTFMYLSDVLRAGDQIDRAVNTTQLTSFNQPGGGGLIGAARPEARLNETDFWAQGLNIGVKWVH